LADFSSKTHFKGQQIMTWKHKIIREGCCRISAEK
jgi:hypothetical protein